MNCARNMKLLFAAIAIGFAGLAALSAHQAMNAAFCMHGRVIYACLAAGCVAMTVSCLKSAFAGTRLLPARAQADLRA